MTMSLALATLGVGALATRPTVPEGAPRGVDVSHHQGKIDWSAVAGSPAWIQQNSVAISRSQADR